MRLWTSQTIEFYNELMENGIAYCTRVSEFAQENDFAYHWIAEQTRKRIGEPPMPGIKLPVWAWYQFDSKKKRKPPLSKNTRGQEPCALGGRLKRADSESCLSAVESPHV